MKKPYMQPAYAIERYELTQNIASCATQISSMDSSCVLNDPDSTSQMKDFAYIGWFVSNHCAESATGMDGFDSICYHTNANATFTS